MDDGSGKERIIQSGLRPFLKAEDLLGKNIILAANLAPRTMRGIESHGMLLATDYRDENGKNCVEVLEAPWVEAGTVITLEGCDSSEEKPLEISAEDFFAVKIECKDKNILVDGKKLLAKGKPLVQQKTLNGEVH